MTDQVLTECQKCNPGKFRKEDSSEPCEECAKGYYQPDEGEAACLQCVAGQFNDRPGLTECQKCDPGKFRKEDSSKPCEDCAKGYYQPDEGRATCLQCVAGRYSPDKRSIACIDCPRGWFQQGKASPTCDKCTAGRFQQRPRKTSCQACALGMYADMLGQSSCKACGMGHYTPSTATKSPENCLQCPEGRFGPDEALTLPECPACGAGMFTRGGSARGATQGCSYCLPGTFSNDTANAICEECPVATFGDATLENRTTCHPCPDGYNSSAGSSVPFNCTPIEFRNTYENIETTLSSAVVTEGGDPIRARKAFQEPMRRGDLCLLLVTLQACPSPYVGKQPRRTLR